MIFWIVIVLLLLAIPTVFVLKWNFCDSDNGDPICPCTCCSERRRLQRQRQQQEAQQRQQHQAVVPSDLKCRVPSKPANRRSNVGHILQSTMNPHTESNDNNEEDEVFTEVQLTGVPVVAIDGLNMENSNCVSTNVQLSIDFGDFDIHPLNDVSCPICLMDYEHGDTIQRNASKDDDCNYGRTKMVQSVVNDRCDHMFHRHCISTWIESNSKAECPICRRFFAMGKTEDTVTC